jgi:hypothetical protein
LSRTPRERLAAVVRHHVSTILEVDGLPILVLAEAAAANDEALLARFRAITGELGAILVGLLAEARRKVRRPSHRALAASLFGLGAVVALQHRLAADPALEREARETLPAFLVERLLGPEPARAPARSRTPRGKGGGTTRRRAR